MDLGLDGRPAVRLTTNFAVPDRSPTWSPDGHRIAFTRLLGTTDKSQEIYVMNTDGTGAKRLTKNEVATSKLHWRRLMGEGKCQVRLTQECGLAPSNLT